MAAQSGKTETTAAAGEEGQKSPEQIEAEIEATREELGETVSELADKADVKKQAKRKVADTKAKATAKKDELKDKAAAQKEATTAKVAEATPESARAGVKQAATEAQQLARENPVQAAAVGAFVGGLVVGWMLARR